MRNEELMKKWAPVLEHSALPAISDNHREAVTATLLENTEQSIKEGSSLGNSGMLSEAAPSSNTTDGLTDYDPVLISLVRRAMPNLVAYDIVGVQPMTGPTGLIFAMKSIFETAHTSGSGNTVAGSTEALFDNIPTGYAGTGNETRDGDGYTTATGTGMSTTAAEQLGDAKLYDGDTTGDPVATTVQNPIAEMSFKIEKVSVTAKSRALKAEYTSELAQDLKAIHGLDAETELANMLSAELLAEINREVVQTVFLQAKVGAQSDTATAGTFNLDVDANGRWSVEKFKGLMFQIEREANEIAQQTRRGKGNIVIASSDVASALQMAGILDYAPALNNTLSVDDAGNTFAGVLNGRYKVYVDPYAGANYLVVGYKGTNAFDAGIFYCPYVPLQMVRAVGENSFQSKIGFKTRYGLVSNPLTNDTAADLGSASTNAYYRKVKVTNLL